jgi:hypothetical protein
VDAALRRGARFHVIHDVENGALRDGTDRQLDRLERALSGADVEDRAAEEVEHAEADLATEDLLLVRDHLHDLEGLRIDEAEVHRHIHDEELSASGATQARDFLVACECIARD